MRVSEDVSPAFPMMRIEGSDSVVCTSMRIAEHSDNAVLRFFETSGRKCSAVISVEGKIKSVEEVNFLENSINGKSRLKNGKIHAEFQPFEVKTILVEI